MSNLQVITNNIPRLLICWYELTDQQREKFDYMDAEEQETMDYVKYKGEVYALNEFMRFDYPCKDAGKPKEFDAWHGYISDSFFSGILIRYCDYPDNDHVVMGWYLS